MEESKVALKQVKVVEEKITYSLLEILEEEELIDRYLRILEYNIKDAA